MDKKAEAERTETRIRNAREWVSRDPSRMNRDALKALIDYRATLEEDQ
jgi:hypothetical protein